MSKDNMFQKTLLFPTQEMYKLPTGEAYTQTKNASLLQRDTRYTDKNVQAKWDFLIRQFSESLPEFPEAARPNGLTTQVIQQRLEAFRVKRRNTTASLYNLSLEQCNHYFEDFLFLYTTDDPRFKLTPAAKNTLLCSIIRAMGVCETGLNTEFYAALQEVQRDTDWVRSELSKARSECIRDLHKLYNRQHKIADSMNTHVYDHFVTMANRRKLGIEQKETIWDAYSHLMRRQSLNTCFNNHYKRIFVEYERNAQLTLMTYVNNEINAVLGPDRWQNNPILSRDDIAALNQVMRMHFREFRTDDFVKADYTEFEKDEGGDFILEDGERVPILSSIATQLKPKAEFNQALANLIQQKTLTDGYFLSIEQLIAQPALRRQVTLRNQLTWDEMIATWTAISTQPTELIRQAAQHSSVIRAYPELILKHVQNCPELLPLLTSAPVHIYEQILTTVADELQHTLDDPTQLDRMHSLLNQLVDFFDGDPAYLKRLPDPLLRHPQLAKALVSKNGLLWSILSPELQQNPQITQMAIAQNPTVEVYTSSQSRQAKLTEILALLPEQIRSSLNLPGMQTIQDQPIDVQIRRILRLEAYAILLTRQELSATEFLSYAPSIRPDMLRTAINYRMNHHLKPLPIIGQSKKAQLFLKKFEQDICNKLSPDIFNESPLAIRNQAEMESKYHANPHCPFTYLANSRNWIQGFQQYKAYQTGEGHRTQHIRAMLLALLKALLWAIAIYLFIHAFLWIFPAVITFVDTYSGGLLLGWLATSTINLYFRSRILGTINHILCNLFILDVNFIVGGLEIVRELLFQVFKQLGAALKYVVEGGEAWLQSKEIEHAAQQNWLDQADTVIARLRLLNEPASEQKALLLMQIKEQMSQEPDAARHPGLINKRYPIRYQQRDYQISFADVAASRRDVEKPFTVETTARASLFGLFRMPTSSERCLREVQHEARNDVIPVIA